MLSEKWQEAAISTGLNQAKKAQKAYSLYNGQPFPIPTMANFKKGCL